jgi:predicted transcriptional regulator
VNNHLRPREGAEEPTGPEPQPAEESLLPPDELLTVPQIAERAGIHENTVRKHLKAQTIPFFLRDLTTGAIMPGSAPQTEWPARYQYLLSAEVVAHLASQVGDHVIPAIPAEVSRPPSTTSSQALAGEAERLRSELSNVERNLATIQDQLEETRAERDWLRSHLTDITSFLPAAREEVDHVRSDLEQLQDRAQQLERERDLERQARRLAAIRFKSLSWWRRTRTDLEVLVQEELQNLRDQGT